MAAWSFSFFGKNSNPVPYRPFSGTGIPCNKINIHGEKSHDIVESALKVLENMRHRGAEGADNKTGDGAGIMLQIPHEFILLQGIPVPEKGRYGKVSGLISK